MSQKKYIKNNELVELNLGCGGYNQDGYLNVDFRYIRSTNLITSISWCKKYFKNKCEEIYISHTLKHFKHPGKNLRSNIDTVLGVLNIIRIVVPDF